MKKGDFVLIDFVGRVSSSGEIFDLTVEDVAKEEKVSIPDHKYKPYLVIVGAGMVASGIDEQLLSMRVGEEKEFELPPEKGFGSRDPHLVRIMSMSKFLEQKINPVPGIFVTIDHMRARIQSVSGGRVRVDFNHPLSGRHVKYWVRLNEEIKDAQGKVKALLIHYSIKAETEIKEDALTITHEKPINEFMKKILNETIRKWIAEVKKIEFIEAKKAKT